MPAGLTYAPISTQTLASDTATVTFSSIPQTYTDLHLVVSSRVTGGNNSNGVDSLAYYNSDQGANYSYSQIYANGSTKGSNRGSGLTYSYIGVTSNTSTSEWATYEVDIMNYSSTTKYKTTLARPNSPYGNLFRRATLWRSSAAITSITLYNELSLSFKAGSTFTLYGIAAA